MQIIMMGTNFFGALSVGYTVSRWPRNCSDGFLSHRMTLLLHSSDARCARYWGDNSSGSTVQILNLDWVIPFDGTADD